MYTHNIQFRTSGMAPHYAKGALIMIHGRGSTATQIMMLASELKVASMAIYAPQATNNSWYPYSFMAPEEENQPALDSALDTLNQLVSKIASDGIPIERIYFTGFSQGACLGLEYVTRNAQKYGGVVAFTGGLIGERLNVKNYRGDFESTPVLITTGDPDPHVPLARVEQSVEIIKNIGGDVLLKVYKGRSHTISMEEIELANTKIFDDH